MSKLNRLKLDAVTRRVIWAAGAAASRASAWIHLAVDPSSDLSGDGPVWIQVAAEGHYEGHKAGPFTMDAAMFGELIANLHAHPSFKAGPDGKGSARVIPFDWRHASEQSPLFPGAIDAQKAESWCYDLETRIVDGKLTLWSLTELLEPAKGYIQAGKIQWTSVTIWPHAIDPVTARDVGWYLSSIAFTNDPFVQGMTPIAASRYVDPYDRPETASEVIEKLRRLFGLAEMADLGAVLTQIATLKAAATGTMAAPPGVDVNELVGALRVLFNLRTLATVEEVFAEADKLLSALAEEEAVVESTKRPQALAAAAKAAQRQNPSPAAPVVTEKPKEHEPMDPKVLALLALISGSLGIQASATPSVETIEAELRARRLDKPGALKTLADLPSETLGLVIALGNGLKLEGAASETSGSATAKVKALLGALGVQDVDAACNELLSRMAQAKELMAAVPELEAMLDEQMAKEHDEAIEDVGTALELRGYSLQLIKDDTTTQDLADAMSVRRCGGIDLRPEATKKLSRREKLAALKKLAAARTDFWEKYGVKDDQPVAAPGAHYLTRSLFGQSAQGQGGGQQLGAQRGAGFGGPVPFGREGGQGGAQGQQPKGAPGTPAAGQGSGGQGPSLDPLLDLSRYSGNLTERSLAAAEARMGADNWKKLSRPQQFEKAAEVKQILQNAGHDLTVYMGGAAADAA